MGIPVEPPNVQFSDANFTPHDEAIRFGLTAIKNVGRNAIESISDRRGDELEEKGKQVRFVLGVLREGGSAADEQARAGVADQGGRAGFVRPAVAADCRG